jgi:hypothetical protein
VTSALKQHIFPFLLIHVWFFSVFVVEQEDILPQLMLSFVNLLVLDDLEWQRMRLRGKPPKPKATDDVLTIIEIAILIRLERYPTTIQVSDLHAEYQATVISATLCIYRMTYA